MRKHSLNAFLQPLRIPRFVAYLFAIAISFGAYGAKLQLSDFIEIHSPFLFGEIAVILSALYAGTGPALVATVLTTLGADYFFMGHVYSFGVGTGALIPLGVYVVQSLLVVLLINRMQYNARNLIRARDELETRVHERTREVEAANAELRRSNRELEDFAHIASHDLQEPLRKIQNFSHLLAEELGPSISSTAQSHLEVLQRSTERMRRLIEDLLAYSRVSMRPQQYAPVDLNLIVQDVIHDLEFRIEELGAEITVDILPTINADPTQMQQLFQNLFSNSLKFHREGVPPCVRVRTFAALPDSGNPGHGVLPHKHVHISIADNGIGFDPAYREKVFEMFERLHGRSGYTGTGIGLAVCKKIVERHGGSISVDSETGKGTTFLVTLPTGVE